MKKFFKRIFCKKDVIMTVFFLILSIYLYFMPSLHENYDKGYISESCKAEVLSVDNSNLRVLGILANGEQNLQIKILDGTLKGQTVPAINQLTAKKGDDKIFKEGDTAFVVLTKNKEGGLVLAVAMDYYRLDLTFILVLLFSILLIAFGGTVGAKALISFIFSCLMILKIIVPLTLQGYDPIWLGFVGVVILTAVIIFLVTGLTRCGISAFSGAIAGVLTTCVLASVFTDLFKINGAVMPFSEILLYSGYSGLNLNHIFIAGVFFASSGAVMDLAVDISTGMSEIVEKRPDISRVQLGLSGIKIGRAVVGTMTTTLLLAYSGGYFTLLMAFQAQDIPVSTFLNYNQISAEIVKTLVGSLGLVLVAPFTALIASLILKNKSNTVATDAAEIEN
ncbi:YibE/F family protein [Lentisphaerota bacterium WC36G]|nr:YibE/F family protein [Lentisphaerae bacterium WC36]